MRTEKSFKLTVACLLLSAFIVGNLTTKVSAATLVVTRADDRNANCVSNVDCSLREAVSAAASNDTIEFSPAVFNQPRVITLTGTGLTIFKNLTINGPGANLLTVRIFDPSQYEVFDFHGTNFSVHLSGMRIADGSTGVRIGFSNVTATLDRVDISNNFGPGVFVTGSNVVISNSLVSHNQGGGVNCNFDATMTIVNSTVSGNTSNFGGGIVNFTTLNLVNVTVTNNTATTASGGIRNVGTLNLLNTIIAGNSAPTDADATGLFTSQGNNLVGNTTGNSGWATTDKINTPANLAALALNGGTIRSHLPNAGSAAINAGNSCVLNNSCLISLSSPLTSDQRGAGFPRQVGNAVDIGAVERNAPSVAGISGRVTTQTGKGIARALIALTISSGETRHAMTNAFGYYRFSSVPTGATYAVAVSAKRFTFAPRTINFTDEITNLNFAANN